MNTDQGAGPYDGDGDELVTPSVVVTEKPLGETVPGYVKYWDSIAGKSDAPGDAVVVERDCPADEPVSIDVRSTGDSPHIPAYDHALPDATLSDDLTSGEEEDEESIPIGSTKCECGERIPNVILETHQDSCHAYKRRTRPPTESEFHKRPTDEHGSPT